LKLNVTGTPGDYCRDLDLDTAVSTTRFTVGGVRYVRQVFASSVDQVIVVRQTADQRGAVDLEVGLDRPADFRTEAIGNDTLAMTGQAQHEGRHLGVRWQARVVAKPEGGTVKAHEDSLPVEGADAVTVYLAAATDYNMSDPAKPLKRDRGEACRQQLSAAMAKPFDELLADHVKDHKRLFHRCQLDLGGWEADAKPTDRRLAAVREGPEILQIEDEFVRQVRQARSKLCLPRIGPDGRLMEWAEPFEERIPSTGTSPICSRSTRAGSTRIGRTPRCSMPAAKCSSGAASAATSAGRAPGRPVSSPGCTTASRPTGTLRG
jgi:hypothetical protein